MYFLSKTMCFFRIMHVFDEKSGRSAPVRGSIRDNRPFFPGKTTWDGCSARFRPNDFSRTPARFFRGTAKRSSFSRISKYSLIYSFSLTCLISSVLSQYFISSSTTILSSWFRLNNQAVLLQEIETHQIRIFLEISIDSIASAKEFKHLFPAINSQLFIWFLSYPFSTRCAPSKPDGVFPVRINFRPHGACHAHRRSIPQPSKNRKNGSRTRCAAYAPCCGKRSGNCEFETAHSCIWSNLRGAW